MRTPEERLLLNLVSGQWAAKRDAVPAEIGAEVAWARVLHMARKHEVVPLVHRSLELFGLNVPADVREQLASGRRTVAARNGLLAREVTNVLQTLHAAGVAAIPLKGVYLAERLYGDPTLRDSSDIDVLVPRQRVRDALQVLRRHGYAPEFTERFFEAVLLRGHIEYTLARRQHGFEYLVDLHWGIGWSARDDRRAAEALWVDAKPTVHDGVEMWAMSREWELLTLAVHAARHGWQPLKWLVDVHDYCASQPLDWRMIRQTAYRYGWLSALEQTLWVCQAVLGTAVPAGIAARIPRRWPSVLDEEPAHTVPEALLPLRVIRRPADRARYALRQLLIPTLAERRLIRLPSALRLFYYPLRPVRLGGKWGWRALQRLGGC